MKKLLLLLSAFIFSTSNASAATNATVDFSVDITPGCFFSSPIYVGDFGNIPSGEVGMTGVEVSLTCAYTLDYAITPMNTTVTTTGGYNEQLVLSAYKNSTFSDQLSTSNNIVSVGSGNLQKVNIYFKLNGKGRDFGQGNSVVEKFNFNSAPIVYPIVVTY